MKRAVVVFIALITVFAGLLSHQLGNIKAGSEGQTDTSDTGYEYYTGEDQSEEDSGVKKTEKKSADQGGYQRGQRYGSGKPAVSYECGLYSG